MRSTKHKNNAVMNMRGKQLTRPSNSARCKCVMVSAFIANAKAVSNPKLYIGIYSPSQ